MSSGPPGVGQPVPVSASRSRPLGLSRRCPECDSAVKRVLRTPRDKQLPHADAYRRYRCRSDHCSWSGLLRVSKSRRFARRTVTPRSPLVQAARVLVVMGMATGAAWGAVQALTFMMGL